MLKSKAKIRLFVDGPLAAGLDLALDDAPTHYLAHVMRVRTGETVLLFNGRDGEWACPVVNIGKNVCVVSVERRTRAQTREEGPWLAFAPVKKTAVDFIAGKATELGVSRLCPTFTERTAVGRVNVGRLRANAIEAAEQSERLSVPEVMDAVSLRDLLAAWPSGRTLFIMHGRGRGLPIAERLSAIQSPPDGPQALAPGFLIGPEGGFGPAELDRALELPFVSVIEMGPRVLRCETAALAALACWQAMAGDWRERRHPLNSGDR